MRAVNWYARRCVFLHRANTCAESRNIASVFRMKRSLLPRIALRKQKQTSENFQCEYVCARLYLCFAFKCKRTGIRSCFNGELASTASHVVCSYPMTQADRNASECFEEENPTYILASRAKHRPVSNAIPLAIPASRIHNRTSSRRKPWLLPRQ